MRVTKEMVAGKANELSKMIFRASSVVNYQIDQCFACISLSDIGLYGYAINVYIGIAHKKEYIDIILVRTDKGIEDNIYASRVYAERENIKPSTSKIKTQFYCDDIRLACKNTIRFAVRRESA